ncbi:MAG: carbon-nitrogen hydrolase [Myxococcota bacterium]|jgi:N-carbamoylputrescine amidase|nr:carbon-nitrogen hydrolase [Myxococcota bacterium]
MTLRDPVRVGLIQQRASEDIRDNLPRALSAITEAASRGAQIVCLQELFGSLYPCQDQNAARFDWAEPIPGPTSQTLSRHAADLGIVIVGSIFERRAAGLYHNSAVVFDADGQLAGLYRKMHIPDDPLYYEKFYFTPGDRGWGAVRTRFGSIGVAICWDQWFPEAARLMALAGAEMLFYPTAIGWQFDEGASVDTVQHEAWETVQRGHAIANGVFVAAVNRVGPESLPGQSGIRFWGQSFLSDPMGRVLGRASSESEETLVVECDPAAVERTRRDWPFLRDRRVDAYSDLTRRFRDES